MYKARCGYVNENEDNPIMATIACQIVGCKDCKRFNGEEFYIKDIAKGISTWAKERKGKL